MATTLPNTGAVIPAMTEPADQAVNNAAFAAIDTAVGARLAEKGEETLLNAITMPNLRVGSLLMTKGFYSLGDGGGASYSVHELTGTEEWVNSGLGFELNSNGEIKAGTKKLKYVIQNGLINIKHFGAKGDYDADTQNGTNNTIILQKIFDFAYVAPIDTSVVRYDCPTVLFPSAFGYCVTNTITCKEGVNIDMTSSSLVMLSDTITNKKALVIGQTTKRSFNANYVVDVRRNVVVSTTSEDDCGVEFINPYWCNIYLKGSRNFSVGARMAGDPLGAVYNTVKIGFITGSNIGLDVIGRNGGWGNENLFIGGEFMNGVGNCYGVRIKNDGNLITLSDNNLFIKPSFELNAGVGFEAVPFLIQDAISTKVIAMRLEDANNRTLYAVSFTGNAENSEIEVSAGGDGNWLVDDKSEKKTNFVKMQRRNYVHYGKTIYSTELLSKKACYYDGATSIHVAGLHSIAISSSNIEKAISAITIGTNGLTLPGSRALCRMVDTSKRKKFIIQGDADVQLSYYVRCYDANGNVLLPSVENVYAYAGNSGLFIGTGGTTYWTSLTDSVVITFSEAVKSASIGVGNGINIRGFSISVDDMFSQYVASWAGYEEIQPGSNIATTPPTAGTWEKGKRIFNDNPIVGQPKSWICTASGTPGTWVSEGVL